MSKRERCGRILQVAGRPLAVLTIGLTAALILVQAAIYLGVYVPGVGEELPLAAAAAGEESELFGTLTFVTEEAVSIPEAQLLLNGQRAGDFSAGRLTVRVYEGDLVQIDGRRYERELAFALEGQSLNLQEEALAVRTVVQGQVVTVGTAHFK